MELHVAAIVLAAGSSTRMGASKQLLPFGSKPVIRHCVDTLTDAGIGDIVVVCGAKHEACREALQGSGAAVALNTAPDSQMADSVRVGLAALDKPCTGVLVSLADHPLISSETVQSIVSLHSRAPGRIIIPAFEGRRGHPVLFPFAILQEIRELPTLRDIVRRDAGRVLEAAVPDEGVVLDMDTEQDYRAIIGRFAERRKGTAADGKC